MLDYLFLDSRRDLRGQYIGVEGMVGQVKALEGFFKGCCTVLLFFSRPRTNQPQMRERIHIIWI